MRIVIATLGSLGDLYPFLALGSGLAARGHRVLIATNPGHRRAVEAAGLGWRLMGQDPPDDTAFYAQAMDAKTGPEFIFRHWVAPHVRQSYFDLRQAAAGTDLLISTGLSFAVPLLAERMGIRWISAVLQPIAFFSAHDPAVLTQARALTRALHPLGRVYGRGLRAIARAATRSWGAPIGALRRDLGLPLPGPDPLWEGQHASEMILAMFPRALAPRQPDWPPQVRVTGAAFWDGAAGAPALAPPLRAFLDHGAPPIVFTLGSAAVRAAGRFYADSAAAAAANGRRALLLMGSAPENWAQLPAALPEGVMAVDYAPHAPLFARAAAIVHQGGIGTAAQAMRAGKPMLVVPFSHDQPDNAARLCRLGVARVLPPARFTAARAARALRRLLADRTLAARAAMVGEGVRGEQGVADACDAIEALFVPRHRAALAGS